MGTKTTTQQTSQYDPSSMSTFHGLQGPLSSTLGYFMGQGGGINSPFFRAALGQGTAQAAKMGQNMMSNITQQGAGNFGGANLPGYMRMMQQQAGMNTSALQQNAFWNALQQATGLQMGAAGLASGYKPLQTGATQVQSTGGLGSWLPQLVSGVAGAFIPGAGLLGGLFRGSPPGAGGMGGPATSDLLSSGFAGTNPGSFNMGFGGAQVPNPYGGGGTPTFNPFLGPGY